jgi:hypothetical protein
MNTHDRPAPSVQRTAVCMRQLTVLLVALLLLSACERLKSDTATPEVTPEPTPAQTSLETAQQFLQLWKAKQYGPMYGLLSTQNQTAITRDKFVSRYEAIADEATIQGIDYTVSAAADPGSADVPFVVTLHTNVFGDIVEDHVMTLTNEGGWRVVWTPNLIFRDLGDTNLIHRFVRVPKRGSIVDRNGQPLAYDGEETVIGTSKQSAGDPKAFAATVAPKLLMPAADIEKALATNDPDYFFIPLKVLPTQTPQAQIDELTAIRGITAQARTRRVYPLGAAA